jgi:LPS-assembly protein
MLDRLFLVYFLLLFASISFAEEANWNCQQDKSTKEWVCVGSADPAGDSSKATPESKPMPEASRQADLPKTDDAAVSATPSSVRETNKKILPVEEQVEKTESTEAEPEESDQIKKELAQTPSEPKTDIVTENPQSSPPLSEAPPPVIPATQKPMPTSAKPAVITEDRQRGWNCDNKGKDGNWNCQLVGADPKGEARVVDAEDKGLGLFNPTFDSKEEHVFYTLRDRFRTNPWGNCSIQLGTQKYYIPDNKKQRDKADIDMNSNAAEIYDNEIGSYQGRVELKRADQQASSNAANYDSVSELLDLHGNVFYSEEELSLYTESANLKLASDEARLRDALFISPTTPLRGRANAVYRDSKTQSRYKDVAYTSCEPGNQDWIVHATDLKMNKTTGDGSAKNAWLEFKGVPVFYSPYLTFPIDDRRKTGFLAPSFGNTQKGGFNFSAPFYWNIAPNFDATLRPRYYTKRGALLAGDFRYLTESLKGAINAEFMPDDSIRNEPRYLASFKNHTSFTKNINSNIDANIVSDREYFSELGNALSFPYFSNVRSYGDISYVDKGISLVGLIENYQNIDPAFTGRLTPYRRLPQLNLNLDHTFESIPASIGMENEYVYYQHDDSSLPVGHRMNVKPYVSFPLKTASAYMTPKLSLQYTEYLLDQQRAGASDSIGRTVPIASVDSGLFLEKDVNLFGSSLLHTLEPRLFYLFIPKVNQDDIPIFDSSLYDFQYDSLFRENRFSGTDRIQDANQITAALTSRLVDSETGLEKLKISIGEIFHFRNREVNGPVVRVGADFLESPIQTSSLSPLVAEVSSQINKHVSLDGGIQWDPDVNEFVRGKANIHLVNNPGEILNLGFLYRKNNLIKDALDRALGNDGSFGEPNPLLTDADLARLQSYRNNNLVLRSNDIVASDISFRWPIYDNWFAVGRWQYSFLYNLTQEGFFGFEKETCCWRFRVIGRQYVNNIQLAANPPPGRDDLSATQTGLFFQIEFKGLTGIGEKLDDFFSKSIYGYQKKDY